MVMPPGKVDNDDRYFDLTGKSSNDDDLNFKSDSFQNSIDVESFGNYDDTDTSNRTRDYEVDDFLTQPINLPEAKDLPIQLPNAGPKITIGAPVFCTVTGVVAFVQGGIVGGVVGLFQGISHGVQLGVLREPSFPRQLSAVVGSNGRSFGLWMGTYTGVKCTLRSARGRNDMLNSFGAGFAAGVVGSMHTRSRSTMIMSGMASGSLMAILDGVRLPLF
mmetsp:Transcript_8304/g.8462  ORF Transcript_8304/g.8462 Transcript_8304/m.8462 type:complete len:218 (-) Transcript_8304:69-722(-)|eukprot:CAMPEP_0182416778 /NCGR_PEP_ID=MMETSP1167-20130531/1130_1 /TAXON_ID=2988 /ORGANISM="Mallomonas Sp, Strain CCMP3275" /LENGTH=217 /DNA_ID=CAMNT_0024589835 /DNA_START=132 /DNA_END=785 /DNA_ORIENTATION=+